MDDEYREFIKGSFADIQNIGSGKGGGSITGAWFIREFAGDSPWIHLGHRRHRLERRRQALARQRPDRRGPSHPRQFGDVVLRTICQWQVEGHDTSCPSSLLPASPPTFSLALRFPVNPSALTNCASTTSVSRNKKRALLFICFRQDVMLVIEIVERLRQLKRILRHKRRLLRPNCRFHRVVERTRRNQQFPQPVSLRPRKESPGGFLRYLHARRARLHDPSAESRESARPRIGNTVPVSPSKLSASLKSKAMIAMRVNFSRKNRSAPTAIACAVRLMLLRAHVHVTLLHFRQRGGIQPVNQIVGLHARGLCAR